MSKKVLFIIGTSGSGKSYITSKLSEGVGFYKLSQYTTRPKRENEGDEYYYITKDHYDIIEDRLIATTIVNNNYYGTIPTFKDNGDIAVIIVNELGLKNGLAWLSRNRDVEYKILYITGDSFEERKEGRNIDDEKLKIDKLLSDFSYIQITNTITNPVSINTVRDVISKNFNNFN